MDNDQSLEELEVESDVQVSNDDNLIGDGAIVLDEEDILDKNVSEESLLDDGSAVSQVNDAAQWYIVQCYALYEKSEGPYFTNA